MQEYYDKFYSGLIEKPDFSCVCPICGSPGCSVYHGYYTRAAICPVSGFSVADFPVMRFKCRSPHKKKYQHTTFSLLPSGLAPYRKPSLTFMVLAVWLRLSNTASLFKAMELIESELNRLEDTCDFISVSALSSWSKMIEAAYVLLLSHNTHIGYKPELSHPQTYIDGQLHHFVEYALSYEDIKSRHPIRGPDALALNIFRSDNIFIFGVASQHRAK